MYSILRLNKFVLTIGQDTFVQDTFVLTIGQDTFVLTIGQDTFELKMVIDTLVLNISDTGQSNRP